MYFPYSVYNIINYFIIKGKKLRCSAEHWKDIAWQNHFGFILKLMDYHNDKEKVFEQENGLS